MSAHRRPRAKRAAGWLDKMLVAAVNDAVAAQTLPAPNDGPDGLADALRRIAAMARRMEKVALSALEQHGLAPAAKKGRGK